MNIPLRTPTPADLAEYNENAERPYFIAESVLMDGGAVELEIGGVTIAGIFHPEDAYAIAHGVLDMAAPEAPLCHDSVEWQAANLSEDELEWAAWSALEALHSLRGRQEAAVAPVDALVGENTLESVCGAELPTQRFVAVPHDFMSKPHGFAAGGTVPWTAVEVVRDAARPHYANVHFLEPVGVMSHEEVATAFAKLTDKSEVA